MSAASHVVGARLGLREVEQVRAQLLAALNRGGALRVELGAVVAADTAGAQLLLALGAEAAYRGVPLEWVGAPAVLTRLMETLGLAAVLGTRP